MAKARSPGYPVIGLREAIEKVNSVYNKDYQNPIPRLVAVQHMGYNGLNGKSLGVLSALIKYALLEGRGADTRVTDLAVQIIAHPPGSADRGDAIKLAASAPDLFSELDSRFQGAKVSDQAIRSYLLTMKFIPSAAEMATRAYRETKQLVEDEYKGYNPEENHIGQQVMHTNMNITPGAGHLSVGPSTLSAVGAVNKEIANIRVSKDCAIRLVADGPYNKRSIEALVKNLELQLQLGTYDEQLDPDGDPLLK
jgi:hypothetical protein